VRKVVKSMLLPLLSTATRVPWSRARKFGASEALMMKALPPYWTVVTLQPVDRVGALQGGLAALNVTEVEGKLGYAREGPRPAIV
jgi:hypothetical protein